MGRERLPYAGELLKRLAALGYTVVDTGADMVDLSRDGITGDIDLVNHIRVGGSREIYNDVIAILEAMGE